VLFQAHGDCFLFVVFPSDSCKQGDSTICGTREFIAPEIWEYKRQSSQGNGEGPYKAASDVYSLGMTFFEILTHKRPFMGLQQGGETLDFLRWD
jgi:serine/threonine protein kinase